MEYYSAIRKKEILPCGTTWMDLEGIDLSEVSWTKTNTTRYHLCVESKKRKLNSKNQRKVVVASGWLQFGENREKLVKGTHFQLEDKQGLEI